MSNAMENPHQELVSVGMTKIDLYTIEHIKQNAHGYLTPILHDQLIDDPIKELSEEENEINKWIIEGIMNKSSANDVGRKLGNIMRTMGYNRDYERVARTLMGEHYSWGHWQYQMETVKKFGTNYTDQFKKKMKIEETDILVYKLSSKSACKRCHKIWAHEDGTPKLYTEKYLRSQESNYGKPKSRWKPQIGLMHPNCSESPLIVARLGTTNIVYPKIFDYNVQDDE
jgi:hypothetical protein